MRILLIIPLLCLIGCGGIATMMDQRTITVTSKQNMLSKVYGPYFPQDQEASIVEQYQTGILDNKHLERQELYKIRQEKNRYTHR